MIKRRSFPTTTWTKVACASDPTSPHARAAFEDLLQRYWYPIYAFIRRSGIPPDKAEDLTQGFFLFALEHGTFGKADPARGRFRSFILTCLTHFMRDEWRRETAVRRGGVERPISFDGLEAQARYAAEPVDTQTPEHLLTQKLAHELLDAAMRELQAECAADGHGTIFVAVRGHLDHDGVDETYFELAASLHMNVNTLKAQVRRWRKRLHAILVDHVEQIVVDEDDVKPEMVALEESLSPVPGASPARSGP